MNGLEDIFTRWGGYVVLAGAVILGARIVWDKFLRPLVRLIRALSDFIEAQPTLLEIAHEFKPNDGNTLRDQIDVLKIEMSNVSQQLEVIVQQVARWDGTERRSHDDPT